MLESLHVRNLALIREQEIFFTGGLNILTGETGAGKSILIGSVALALGAKADKAMIREGAEEAFVELVFALEQEEVRRAVREAGFAVEEDGTLIIQRRITPARSTARVCGETVTAKQLSVLAEMVLHLHGQNEHQILTKKQEQMRILDDYAAKETGEIKDRLRAAYGRLSESEKALEETAMDDRTRRKEADLCRYEIEEIDAAALREGEDESLERYCRRMGNAEKLAAAFQTAAACLTGDDAGAESASALVARAIQEIARIRSLDEEAGAMEEQLRETEALLSDAARTITGYLDGLSYDPQGLAEATERLDLLHRLKEKYADINGQIADVIAYRERQEERLQQLTELERYRETLQQAVHAARAEALREAENLSALRKKSAAALEERMREALAGLNFAATAFEIRVEAEEKALTANGYDDVTYLISTNPGESLKPLASVASGGELSRIMLALTTVIADREEMPAMIFDEIDAGISGKTAWKVAGQLGHLSGRRQVICITHLPQIAAMADTHFFIEKTIAENRTVTGIRRLEEEETTKELARLLGTGEMTDAAFTNAREMLAEAKKVKEDARG